MDLNFRNNSVRAGFAGMGIVASKISGALVPIAYAQPTSNSMAQIYSNFTKFIINPILYLLVMLSIVMFLWGMVEFVASSDNPEKSVKGKKHILWGLIGLVIVISAFGIMNLICMTIVCQ